MGIEAMVLEKKGNNAKILVKDADEVLLNSLRRAIIANVPTLAIEDVTIYENESVMFDEFLAHRLGLMPLSTDKTYKKGEEITLTLEKEGPCTIYGKDFKCSDPKVEIVTKKAPITKLKKGQKIKLEAKARMGTGKEHTKYTPAIIGYREAAKIEIGKECDSCEECIKECPKNVLEIKAKKIVLTNAFDCNLCGACADYCPKHAVRITAVPNEFVFSMESIGQEENSEIIESAIKELEEKVQEFKKALSELKE